LPRVGLRPLGGGEEANGVAWAVVQELGVDEFAEQPPGGEVGGDAAPLPRVGSFRFSAETSLGPGGRSGFRNPP
jgi:hypothetical protein